MDSDDLRSSSLNSTVTASTSQIFETASHFNLNQNDANFYCRETMHLLAKFLATHGDNTIFRSLYEYAPDNLSWLWAFIDWDSPIDVRKIPSQEEYQPFEINGDLDDSQIRLINKMFAESPLIQYKYRETIMIGDVYKFIERVNKIQVFPVAKALFLLYFPRFTRYVNNPLRHFTCVKLLRSNLLCVEAIDNIILSLIKSRYANLAEYKQNIASRTNLPSYIKTILGEEKNVNAENNKFSTKKPIDYTKISEAFDLLVINSNCMNNSITTKPSATSYLTDVSNSLFPSTDTSAPSLITSYQQQQQQQQQQNQQSPYKQQMADYCGTTNELLYYQGAACGTSTSANNNNLSDFPIDLSTIATPSITTGLFSSENSNNRDLQFSPRMVRKSIATPKTPIMTNNGMATAQFLYDSPTSNKNYDQWSNGVNYPIESQNQNDNFQPPLTPPPSESRRNPNFNTETSTYNTNDYIYKYVNNYERQQMLNDSNESSLASYLKHSAFISSPIARLGINRFNDSWNTNGSSANAGTISSTNPIKSNNSKLAFNNQINKSEYNTGTRARHNSNIDTSFQLQGFSKYLNNDLFIDNTSYSGASSAYSPVPKQSIQNSSQMWCGQLLPKVYPKNVGYSRKVFLGGLPWDVDHVSLVNILQKFGSVKLEVPGKDQKHPRVSTISKTHERSTPGYIYIIFECESSVQRMLADCRKDIKNGGEHYFFSIFIPPTIQNNNNKRGKSKEVEVIPWNQEDTCYTPNNGTTALPNKIDAKNTIFVGALHGMLNAQGLAKIMNEVFGPVIHASLDTDKYKYPIGSGRVTFRDRDSYIEAIKAKYVTIRANMNETDPSPKFEKMIQIDPYLEDAKCSVCDYKMHAFCRNERCLRYYCVNCWKLHLIEGRNYGDHEPMTRQTKPSHG